MRQTMEGPADANFTHPNQDNGHIAPDERMRKLYHAATTGDWNAAEKILQEAAGQRSALLSSPVLSVTSETALHIAAGAKQVKFVEKLLEEDSRRDFIDARDASNNTALCTAAAAGASEIVRKLWNEAPNLICTAGANNMTPAYIAAAFGHEDIASLLYTKHNEEGRLMEYHDKIHLFFVCVNNEMFELASRILAESPDLDCERDSNSETVLHVLARKPSIFTSQRQGIFNQILHLRPYFTSASNSRSLQDKAPEFLEKVISELKKRDRNVLQDIVRSPRHLLFEAAALGNSEFVAKLVNVFPDLFWERDGNGQHIFHTAISKRRLDVFELIFRTGLLQSVIKAWEDETTGNNILHLAAKLPPIDVLNSFAGEAFQMQKEVLFFKASRNNILHLVAKLLPIDVLNSLAGEALQMQKEVLFFKKLQRFVPVKHRDRENYDGKTPKQVFTLEHEELRQKGEEWMKKNASYCLTVATLIVTAAYPASSIIPGGSNDTNKSFNIHHKAELTSVLITNAIAMGLSTTSMIMFFFVLISRFAEEDFISSLPCKFNFGLLSLIVALVCMMVSFLIATVETCVNITRSSYHHRFY